MTRPLLAQAELDRLGQLTAIDDGAVADGMTRTVLRVDLRPTLDPAVTAALTAAASPDEIDLPAGEIAWTSPAIMFTDTWTDEGRVGGGRMFEHAGGSALDLPLPFMVARSTSAMGGHDGAILGGRIDSIDLSTPGPVPATGVFGDNDEGRLAAWDYANGYISGVSVDLRITGYELDFITEVDENGDEWIIDADFRATGWQIAGATGTPFPAFAEARIEIDPAVARTDDEDEPADEEDEVEDEMQPAAAGVVAWGGAGGGHPVNLAAVGLPVPPLGPWFSTSGGTAPTVVADGRHRPPTGWFTDPHLTELTPPTLDGDRYFGHLAPWADHDGGPACHVGYSEVCVCAPRSESGYARFLVGEVETDDGTRVPVGSITLRGGHAPLDAATVEDAAAHYDDTDSAVAYVACGEDDFGIWFAGCVRPGISDDDRFALRASSLSGDWREWPARSGTLELLRVCCVNTPGFAVLRSDGRLAGPTATVAEGRVVALAASGARRLAALKARALAAAEPVTAGDLAALEVRLDRLEAGLASALAVTGPLDPLARARILERL